MSTVASQTPRPAREIRGTTAAGRTIIVNAAGDVTFFDGPPADQPTPAPTPPAPHAIVPEATQEPARIDLATADGKLDALLLPNGDLAVVYGRRGLDVYTDYGIFNVVALVAAETGKPKDPVRACRVPAEVIRRYRRTRQDASHNNDPMASKDAAPVFALVQASVIDGETGRAMLRLGELADTSTDRVAVLTRMGFQRDARVELERLMTVRDRPTSTIAIVVPPMVPGPRKRRITRART